MPGTLPNRKVAIPTSATTAAVALKAGGVFAVSAREATKDPDVSRRQGASVIKNFFVVVNVVAK